MALTSLNILTSLNSTPPLTPIFIATSALSKPNLNNNINAHEQNRIKKTVLRKGFPV